MPGIAVEQPKHVGQQINDRVERFRRAAWAAWQVQDENLSPDAADSTAQRGQWSFLGTFITHTLGNAFQEAAADRSSGFGRDVTFGDTGSAGGYD